MKILIVNAFSDTPEGRTNFQEFVEVIKNVNNATLIL